MIAVEGLSPVLAGLLIGLGIALLALVGWLDHRTEGRPRADAEWPTSAEERRLMRGNSGVSLLMIDHTGPITKREILASEAARSSAAASPPTPPVPVPVATAPVAASPARVPLSDAPPTDATTAEVPDTAPKRALPHGASAALDALFGDVLGDRVA